MIEETQTNTIPFVQLTRTSDTFDLIKFHPHAFLLLSLIALRAKRTSQHSFDGLNIGEAKLGDYNSCGLTRQNYRTALKFLKSNHLITIRVTNKGTVVKLIDSTIFNINAEETNHQNNQDLTISQPSTNHQLTTNNNIINKKYNNIINNYNPDSESESGLEVESPDVIEDPQEEPEIIPQEETTVIEALQESPLDKLKQEKYTLELLRDDINEVIGKKLRSIADKKALNQLKILTKAGHTRQDFRDVLYNIKIDPHHAENNYKWVTLEFVTRPDKFSKFLDAGSGESGKNIQQQQALISIPNKQNSQPKSFVRIQFEEEQQYDNAMMIRAIHKSYERKEIDYNQYIEMLDKYHAVAIY